MDIVGVINQAQSVGLILSVDGDRLNVTGKKTPEAAAIVRQLSTMKAAIVAHLTTPAPDPGDVRSLPPIRNTTGKPLLPPDLWVSGLATFAEAWQREGELCGQFATALGKDGAGFYVRCKGWQWCEAAK